MGAPSSERMSHGIGMEGLMNVFSGVMGTGGSTSYSENIGAIGLTGVASRYVVQIGAALMILVGFVGYFGQLVATIPSPIIGGLYIAMFAQIVGVGLSNLKYVDLDSSRATSSSSESRSSPGWPSRSTCGERRERERLSTGTGRQLPRWSRFWVPTSSQTPSTSSDRQAWPSEGSSRFSSITRSPGRLRNVDSPRGRKRPKRMRISRPLTNVFSDKKTSRNKLLRDPRSRCWVPRERTAETPLRPNYSRPVFWSFIRSSVSSVSPSLNF